MTGESLSGASAAGAAKGTPGVGVGAPSPDGGGQPVSGRVDIGAIQPTLEGTRGTTTTANVGPSNARALDARPSTPYVRTSATGSTPSEANAPKGSPRSGDEVSAAQPSGEATSPVRSSRPVEATNNSTTLTGTAAKALATDAAMGELVPGREAPNSKLERVNPTETATVRVSSKTKIVDTTPPVSDANAPREAANDEEPAQTAAGAESTKSVAKTKGVEVQSTKEAEVDTPPVKESDTRAGETIKATRETATTEKASTKTVDGEKTTDTASTAATKDVYVKGTSTAEDSGTTNIPASTETRSTTDNAAATTRATEVDTATGVNDVGTQSPTATTASEAAATSTTDLKPITETASTGTTEAGTESTAETEMTSLTQRIQEVLERPEGHNIKVVDNLGTHVGDIRVTNVRETTPDGNPGFVAQVVAEDVRGETIDTATVVDVEAGEMWTREQTIPPKQNVRVTFADPETGAVGFAAWVDGKLVSRITNATQVDLDGSEIIDPGASSDVREMSSQEMDWLNGKLGAAQSVATPLSQAVDGLVSLPPEALNVTTGQQEQQDVTLQEPAAAAQPVHTAETGENAINYSDLLSTGRLVTDPDGTRYVEVGDTRIPVVSLGEVPTPVTNQEAGAAPDVREPIPVFDARVKPPEETPDLVGSNTSGGTSKGQENSSRSDSETQTDGAQKQPPPGEDDIPTSEWEKKHAQETAEKLAAAKAAARAAIEAERARVQAKYDEVNKRTRADIGLGAVGATVDGAKRVGKLAKDLLGPITINSIEPVGSFFGGLLGYATYRVTYMTPDGKPITRITHIANNDRETTPMAKANSMMAGVRLEAVARRLFSAAFSH